MPRSINTVEMLNYLLTNPKSFSKAKEKINNIFNNAIYNNKARYQRVLEIADVIKSNSSIKANLSLEELSQMSDKTITTVTNAVRELYFRGSDSKEVINYSAACKSKYDGRAGPHTVPIGRRRVSNMRQHNFKYMTP